MCVCVSVRARVRVKHYAHWQYSQSEGVGLAHDHRLDRQVDQLRTAGVVGGEIHQQLHSPRQVIVAIHQRARGEQCVYIAAKPECAAEIDLIRALPVKNASAEVVVVGYKCCTTPVPIRKS